jgi:hypothetical protein
VAVQTDRTGSQRYSFSHVPPPTPTTLADTVSDDGWNNELGSLLALEPLGAVSAVLLNLTLTLVLDESGMMLLVRAIVKAWVHCMPVVDIYKVNSFFASFLTDCCFLLLSSDV